MNLVASDSVRETDEQGDYVYKREGVGATLLYLAEGCGGGGGFI